MKDWKYVQSVKGTHLEYAKNAGVSLGQKQKWRSVNVR